MKIVHCSNPFQPTAARETYDGRPGEPLRDELARVGIDPASHVITYNALILSPREVLELVPVQGDCIVAVPDLRNQTLKSIAMIGVMAAASFLVPYLSPAIFAGLYATVGAAAAYAASDAIAFGIVAVGGTLAVNAVSSLFEKKPSGASYTWGGAQTVARSGIPIPKGFNKFRAGGNIVESWVDMQNGDVDEHDTDDGADKIGRQWLNIRIDFGFGPAKSITDIRINDKDVTNFADVAYKVLLGTNDQQPVTSTDPDWVIVNQTTDGDTANTAPTTDFDRINNNYPISQRVRCGTNGVLIPGRRSDTQRLEVVVQFPNGVWRYDEDHILKRAEIGYQVWYKRRRSAHWLMAEEHHYINIRETILRQRTVIGGLSPNTYDVKVVKLGAGAAHNPLDPFEHESNDWGDELWIESIQETSYTALAYPNMVQLCLRIMATDQLSGSGISITALVDYDVRSERPEQLASFDTDNPAVVAYDIFSDPLVGAGMPDSRIDLDAFAEWAALCDTLVDDGLGGTQKLARFNGVFEQDGESVWGAFQSVCVMARAYPQRIGTKITVSLDQDEEPVQLFHVGNMYADSYSKDYLDLDNRAQEIEVDYANAEDDYKTRTPLRVITAADMGTAEILKKTRINLLGCTDSTQAYYWGYHKLLENKLKLRTHTWESPVQAIACRIGNIALLQSDVPQWAIGVEVVSATDTEIYVDNTELPWTSGGGYSIVVMHPALKRATAHIEDVAGGVIIVSGFDGSSRVVRVVKGDLDVGIQKVSSSGSNLVLKVESAAGFSPGDDVDLFDVDAMETRAVTAVDGGKLTVSPAFSVAPFESASAVYQTTEKQAIKVRIAGIKRQPGEQKFRITALDHSQNVYEIPAPNFGYEAPPLEGGTRIPLIDGEAYFISGSMPSGEDFEFPEGFTPSDSLAWVSAATYGEAGHQLHIVSCDVDGSGIATLTYADGVGGGANRWTGNVNYAAIGWNSPSAERVSVNGISFVVLTLKGGERICFGGGVVTGNGSVNAALPAGFPPDNILPIAFTQSGIETGDHNAHGFRSYIAGNDVVPHYSIWTEYADGEGHTWYGGARPLIFGWENNGGTVTRDNGWVRIPVSGMQDFCAGAWTALDSRAGYVTNPKSTCLPSAVGGVFPLPTGMAADTIQVIAGPDAFQVVDHPAHGIRECSVDGARNVRTSYSDGEGNIWYGSAGVFAIICDNHA